MSNKLASTIRPGDRVKDGTDSAVVFSGPNRSTKHAGNRVSFLARRDDGTVVRFTVPDTTRLNVASGAG
jgi:hypothetical protein